MDFEASPGGISTHTQSDWPPSLAQLTQLLENKVKIFQKTVSAEEQSSEHRDCLGSHIAQSQELSSHLSDLQRRTEQEVARIHQQLTEVRHQQDLLNSELRDLETQQAETEALLQGTPSTEDSTALVRVHRELQENVRRRAEQAEALRFQEEGLNALQLMLSEDLQRYQEETQRLQDFSDKMSNGMEAEKERTQENNKGAIRKEAKGGSGSSMERFIGLFNGRSPVSPTSPTPWKLVHANGKTVARTEDRAGAGKRNRTVPLVARSNLKRASSVKDLIQKFSGSESEQASPARSAASPPTEPPAAQRGSGTRVEESDLSSALPEVPKITVDTSAVSLSSGDGEETAGQGPLPSTRLTRPVEEAQSQKEQASVLPQAPTDCTFKSISENKGGLLNGSVTVNGAGSESGFDASKQPESPFLETPSTPKPSQNPKYQLFLSSDVMANGSRDTDGPTGENGSRTSRWESNSSRSGTNYRGSLESLASRDWDTMSDRVGGFDSPPRVFNSPYTNSTIDFNPSHRVSEFKDVLSPATSEINLYYSSRSSSPVHTPGAGAPRQRFSAYDTLRRREVAPNVQVMRPGVPNRRDFIEELTKQLDACQKRNQFLEAESVEMEKERNQIRFEMRNLLVNNEDLLRTNAQLQIEMKRTRETMVELQREIQMKTDHLRQLEAEMKEAREVMVEANTQEYAFNYLQQSLQIKIRDSEEALEKQTEHIQMLSEKLWLAERELEQQSIDQEIRDKRTADLTSTVARLELELSEAIQISNQATSEMNLQEKLKHDLVSRVEELEETLLEKNVEAQKLRETVNRLQGEVSGKLFDKERTLEEEIQLRERAQLQCKQAERTLEDLRMEMQTMGQSKDDLVKQLKQAQERMIDLESDLEEMHDNEQRWASKHKRAIEQTEQLQLKLLQMKDLTEQQDCEKAVLERQIRDLRVEVQELQSTRVQEDVITRAENKAKELENSLRTEERNKMVLSNNIGKLERKIGELTEQMEEEHRLANEQKELMAQRIRSLKRQLNEVEEEASRKETQHRHTVRELAEEREANARLQRQLLDQHLKMKRNETLSVRQTLDNLRLDLSDDDEPVTVGQTSTV
ncbi:cingulin isoform X1 [Anguilla rostrata]|uniref:cingulin isoform X1 n=2 Tax=Anguilla rostrata TaxID=7938 RepID=UPI0030CEBB57